jgi:hypothetical protein
MSDTDLDSYPQIGSSAPVDSYQPGEGKQRLDLDEYYKDTDQAETTVMVQGFEAFTFGKISKRLAQQIGLPNTASYDPFPSERNARAGNEGFFSMVAEKFEGMIEGIIKYVRMVIDWVVDTIGGFLGFRKKSAISAETNEKQKDLKKEFEKTIIALGFPVADYSLEAFLRDIPTAEAGPFQLLFMKSKMTSDQDAIQGIADSLPLIQQAVGKLKVASDRATTAQKYLKKVINEEYNRIRVRKSTGQHIGATDSPELNRVLKAILDVKSNLDTKLIATTVNKLYESMYKTKFSDEELATGYDRVRADLKKNLVTSKIKMSGGNVGKTLETIQMLNARYLEISDKELDLSGIKWREIGTIVDKTDADKIKAMDEYFQGMGLQARYQEMGVDVRSFVQYCLSVTNSMLTVEKQTSNLVEWHTKARTFYYNGVIGDAKEISKIIKTVADPDDQAELKRQFKKIGKLRFIKEQDALTLQEMLSKVGAGEKVESNLSQFDGQLKNFMKQTGLGIKL